MKVLFDTCVVFDILTENKFAFESFVAYDIAQVRKFESCLSVSSTTDLVYLLHSQGNMTTAEARAFAKRFDEQFLLVENSASDVVHAAQSGMKDYEDALVAYSAQRYGVDLIVTRNKKDFAESPIPAVTPKEFIDTFKPENIKYAHKKVDGSYQIIDS